MNMFKIVIILRNGVTDITNCPMKYSTVEEVYDDFKRLRMESDHLKFKIDEYLVEYRFEDISIIKIYKEEV